MKKIKSQKGEILATTILGIGAIVSLMFYTNYSENNILNFNFSGDTNTTINSEIELPTFKSKKEIIEKLDDNFGSLIIYDTSTSINEAIAIPDAAVNMGTTTGASKDMAVDNIVESESSRQEHSETNTQVQGVDEADIVKTNGDYIYYIANKKLYIFDTKTTKTKLIKTIEVSGEYDYLPKELYIDENHITVIAQEYIKGFSNHTNMTAMHIYDINTYELLKTVETEGVYISSRKIEDNIYVVTNKYLYFKETTEDNVLPITKETQGYNYNEVSFAEIEAGKIKYFPDLKEEKECNYMLITSINLSELDKKATVDTYFGAGTEIYCSKENLYVVKVEYNYKSNGTTKIHKFNLLDGAVKYVATGEVEGRLLNQYSMDEYENYFRITTTLDTGNNLFILNSKLEKVGALEGLAKGEKIYATRFMGDKCYLVTYKTVDPLFVLDLSNPEKPAVLGELKIPGYSTYLHPLDENHLIGFGEDSIEKSYINWEGNQEVIAYNVGMKLAIFDISDLNNPKELHSIKIGGRGSSSELLNNPKVLYFNKEEGIFAFPAILTEETKFYEDGTPMYGETIFCGALVYNLSIENGIELRGKIEHKNFEDLKYYKNAGYQIQRILSIEDNFYTISPSMIKVTNIATMEEVEEGRCEF